MHRRRFYRHVRTWPAHLEEPVAVCKGFDYGDQSSQVAHHRGLLDARTQGTSPMLPLSPSTRVPNAPRGTGRHVHGLRLQGQELPSAHARDLPDARPRYVPKKNPLAECWIIVSGGQARLIKEAIK